MRPAPGRDFWRAVATGLAFYTAIGVVLWLVFFR